MEKSWRLHLEMVLPLLAGPDRASWPPAIAHGPLAAGGRLGLALIHLRLLAGTCTGARAALGELMCSLQAEAAPAGRQCAGAGGRAVIHLQFGQAGNRIGSEYWRLLLKEHGVDGATGAPSSEEPPPAQFCEAGDGRYRARAVAVTGSGDAGGRLPLLRYVDESCPSCQWAQGMYTEGCELWEPVRDCIRLEMEVADRVQGVQLVHGTGAELGSGFSSLFCVHFEELWADTPAVLFTHSVLPDEDECPWPPTPWCDAVMSLRYLSEYASVSYIYDPNSHPHDMRGADNYENCSPWDRLVATAMQYATRPVRSQMGSLADMAAALQCDVDRHFVTPGLVLNGEADPPTWRVAELINRGWPPNLRMLCGDQSAHSTEAYNLGSMAVLGGLLTLPQTKLAASITTSTLCRVYLSEAGTTQTSPRLAEYNHSAQEQLQIGERPNSARQVDEAACAAVIVHSSAIRKTLARVQERWQTYKPPTWGAWGELHGFDWPFEIEEASACISDVISLYQADDDHACTSGWGDFGIEL